MSAATGPAQSGIAPVELSPGQVVGSWRVRSTPTRSGSVRRYPVDRVGGGETGLLLLFDDAATGRAEAAARRDHRSKHTVLRLDHGDATIDRSDRYFVCVETGSTLEDVRAHGREPRGLDAWHESAQLIVTSLVQVVEDIDRVSFGEFVPWRIVVTDRSDVDRAITSVLVDPLFSPATLSRDEVFVDLDATGVSASIGALVVWMFTGRAVDQPVTLEEVPAGWHPLVTACTAPHPPIGKEIVGLIPRLLDEPPVEVSTSARDFVDELSSAIRSFDALLKRMASRSSRGPAAGPGSVAALSDRIRAGWSTNPLAVVLAAAVATAAWCLSGPLPRSPFGVGAIAVGALLLGGVMAATGVASGFGGSIAGQAVGLYSAPWLVGRLGSTTPVFELRRGLVILAGMVLVARVAHRLSERTAQRSATLDRQLRLELDAVVFGVAEVAVVTVAFAALGTIVGWFGGGPVPTGGWAAGLLLLVAADHFRPAPAAGRPLVATAPTATVADLLFVPWRVVVYQWSPMSSPRPRTTIVVGAGSLAAAVAAIVASFNGRWADLLTVLKRSRPDGVPNSLRDLPTGPVPVIVASMALLLLLVWLSRDDDAPEHGLVVAATLAALAATTAVVLANLPTARTWRWWFAVAPLAAAFVAAVARAWWSGRVEDRRRRQRIIMVSVRLAAILQSILLIGTGLLWFPALEVGSIRPLAGLVSLPPERWGPVGGSRPVTVGRAGDTTVRVGAAGLSADGYGGARRWLRSAPADVRVEVLQIAVRSGQNAAGSLTVAVATVVSVTSSSDVTVEVAGHLMAIGAAVGTTDAAPVSPFELAPAGTGIDAPLVDPSTPPPLWMAPMLLFADADGDGVADTPAPSSLTLVAGEPQKFLAAFTLAGAPTSVTWAAVGFADDALVASSDGSTSQVGGGRVRPVEPLDSWGVPVAHLNVVDFDELRIE